MESQRCHGLVSVQVPISLILFIEIKHYKKSMRNRIILLVLAQAIYNVFHDNLEFPNVSNFLWRYFVATKDQRNGTAPLFVSVKNLTLRT